MRRTLRRIGPGDFSPRGARPRSNCAPVASPGAAPPHHALANAAVGGCPRFRPHACGGPPKPAFPSASRVESNQRPQNPATFTRAGRARAILGAPRAALPRAGGIVGRPEEKRCLDFALQSPAPPPFPCYTGLVCVLISNRTYSSAGILANIVGDFRLAT